MAEPFGCEQVRGIIPELALGVAPGDERSRALFHVAGCAECRRLLERTSTTADELLLLAPEHEPPPGFDARVIGAMQPAARPSRRRRYATVLVAAAAVVLAAVGATVATRAAYSHDRELAAQYRHTLSVGDGSYLRASALHTTSGERAGSVFAYEGRPSWIFMTVDGAPAGSYDVSLVTRDHQVREVGTCWVYHGRASWGTSVDVPVDSIDHLEMRGNGTTITAAF